MKKQIIICFFILNAGLSYAQFTPIVINDTSNKGRRGSALDPVGDVNNDGIKDYLAGAWLEDVPSFNNAGKAYVINGSNQSIIRELVSPTPTIEGWFGYSVASGYDLSGDGIQDLVIGAPGENGGANGSGRVYVFNGATGVLLYTLTSPTPVVSGNFGNSVLVQNDLDANLSKEIIVGAYQEAGQGITASGKVHIYNGNSFRNTIVSTNAEEYGGFGWRIETATSFLGTTSLIVSAIFENPGASPVNSGVLYAFNMANATSPFLQMIQEQDPTTFGCFGWAIKFYNDPTNGSKLLVMDELGKITTINNDGSQGVIHSQSLTGYGVNSLVTGNFNKNAVPDFATTLSVLYDIGDASTPTNLASGGSGLFIYEKGFGDAIMNLGDINNDAEDEIVTFSSSSIGTTSIVQLNSAPVVPPTITSFTPTSGGTNTLITVTGTNFNTTSNNFNTVKFNGVNATAYNFTSTSFQTSVPAGATTGAISITVGGEKAVSSTSFIVPTSISGITPSSSPVGVSVTITGANFNATPSSNIVFFGAAKAQVSAATTSSLVVTVPVGATYSPVSVLNNGLIAYSGSRFVSTFAGSSTLDATSLASKVDLTTGTGPGSVATGDLDGDGKVDIVTSNQTSNSISIFRNTSTSGVLNSGSFATKVDLNTGTSSGPMGVCIRDFDGDGKLDIAVANSGINSVSVFRNISSAGSISVSSFSARVDFTTGTTPLWCSGSDLDGDGRTDIITANSGNATISVLRNIGAPGSINSGSFDVRSDWFTGTQPYQIAIGDLDGDARPDIATANFSGQSLSLLKNMSSTGYISFNAKVDFAATYPVRVEMGDVDNDGLSDLVVSNYGATGTGNLISVYKNQTAQQQAAQPGSQLGSSQVGPFVSSSLAAAVTYASPTGPYGVGLTDLNGDGYIDVAVSSYQSNKLSIFKNLGTGLFAPKVDFTTGTQPYDVTIADFDGDMRPDVAVPDYGSSALSLFRNTISFLAPTITSFAPQNAAPGATVTITGTNLTGATSLSFGGISATSFTIVSATSITAVVASGASGNVSVTTPGGSATLAGFTFVPAPTITSINPTSAGSGNTVTITGTNLSGATDVTFGNVAATSFTIVSATSITAVVATGDSGSVSVTTPGGIATLAGFTFIPTPTISSFNPTSATTGATVTITGTNLTGATAVSFGGTAATSFSVVSATSITAVVASGTSGSVSVTTPGGIATLAGFIYSNPAPTISSFNPGSGTLGTAVTITGTNFSTTAANNIVKFNGAVATITGTPTATSIVTAVPAGATTGKITVEVGGQTATSATNFTVSSSSNALNFDGTNDIITIPSQTYLNPTTELTMEAWVNLSNSTTNQKIFSKGSSNTGYVLGVVDGKIYPEIWNGVDNFSQGGSIPNGQWTHLAVTFKANGNMISYVNGVQVSSIGVSANSILSNTANLTIGGATFGTLYYVAGSIDEVAIWNVVRTPAQIQSDMLGNISPVASLVAYYDFNQGTAGGSNSSVTSLIDKSSNGNSGTLGNFSLTGTTSNWVSGASTSLTPPSISGFTPGNGAVGTPVTITGSNFDTTPANNIVKFNGTLATITGTPTATSIITSVPTGATTGKITVEVGSQIATSATDFTVTAAVPLTISNESFLTSYDKGSTLTVSVTVNDVNLVSAVNFKSRGITEATTAVKTVAVTAVGNKFEKVIATTDLTDPIGLVYSFQVLDKKTPQGVVNSTTGKAYVKFPTSSTDQVLPGLSFGNQVSNYQIIAVPLELTDKSVTKVFAPLMPYDKTKWRLFDYASNDNREYSAFSTIDAGKGYWLIVKTTTTINPGEGKTVQADDISPFTINLTTGWNLIGNPYNFRVSWPEVLTANSNPAGVGTSLKVFSSGALTDGTVLEKYRGAFVFSNNAVALKIPVLKTLSGRTAEVRGIENSLDQSNWEVKLKLKQGVLSNELGGIGMNPKATLTGKDTFDEVSVPLPDGLGLFELAYPHPEVFADFNKEVVPTQENFTWEFDVKRDDPSASLDLSWANNYFGENDKQLVLFDPSTLQTVDMRLVNHFMVTERTEKLRIFFGGKEYIQRALDKELPWLGSPYPNPAKEELTIPFRVPESHDQMMVQIKIYNGQGAEVAAPMNRTLAKGNYTIKWLPQGESGLYIIRMKIGQQETKAMKVIIN